MFTTHLSRENAFLGALVRRLHTTLDAGVATSDPFAVYGALLRLPCVALKQRSLCYCAFKHLGRCELVLWSLLKA